MARPKLFFGSRDTSALLEVGAGYLDRTAKYDMLAETNHDAPAGAGGEAIFVSLYVMATFTASMVLYVTPILDGASLETQTINLVQNGAFTRQTRVYELGLSVPVTIGGVERGRVYPRGTRFAVRIETGFVALGQTPKQVVVDSVEYEYEVVRESQRPGVSR